jgi:hypothetical protein
MSYWWVVKAQQTNSALLEPANVVLAQYCTWLNTALWRGFWWIKPYINMDLSLVWCMIQNWGTSVLNPWTAFYTCKTWLPYFFSQLKLIKPFYYRTVQSVQCLDYGLDSYSSSRDFTLLQKVQTDSGAHPISYTTRTTGCFLGGLRCQRHKDDHSSSFSTKVKNGGAIHPIPPPVFMEWC